MLWDFPLLHRLRQEFLSEQPGARADYWDSRHTLEQYDSTFGARIGWKWDAVLDELTAKGWRPAGRPALLDWGCGTGIASRRILAHWGPSGFRALHLFDRSAAAREFAADAVRAAHPGLPVHPGPDVSDPFVLLVSHVLNELDAAEERALSALAIRAQAVLWVEPGTPAASRRLIAIRERLRSTHLPLAPCPHGGPCGLRTPENLRHWCHHFAPPPPEVFRSAAWARFGRELGVDLRSLPVSYLVLARDGRHGSRQFRVIGRPRRYKGYATYLACDEDGVQERRALRRQDPSLFRALKEDTFALRRTESPAGSDLPGEPGG